MDTIILSLSLVLLVPTLSWAESNDLEEAKELHARARQLYVSGKYAEAIPLADKVVTITKSVRGGKSS